MANTKKAAKRTAGRPQATGSAPDRGAWREVVGIILIGIGLVLLWFVFDTGSSAGKAVNDVLRGLAGLLRYLIPVAFVWSGIMLAFTSKEQGIKIGRLILVVLLGLCACAAFHVFAYEGVTRDIGTYTFKNFWAASYAYRHGGGGVLGAILCWPLYYWMGLRAGGSIVMLLLIFVADLVLMRKVSLRDLGAKVQERYEDYVEQRAARPERQTSFWHRAERAEQIADELPKTKRGRKADLDELEMWPEQKLAAEAAPAPAEKPQRGRKPARGDALSPEAEALIQDARKRQSTIAEMNVPRFDAEQPKRPKREVEPVEAEAPLEDALDDVPEFLMGRSPKGNKRPIKDSERMRVKEPKPLFGGRVAAASPEPDESVGGRKIRSGSIQFPAADADWQELSIGDALYDENELKAMAEAVSVQPDDSAFVTDLGDDEPPFELPGEDYRPGALPPGGLRLPKAKPAPKPVIGGVAAMPLAKPAPKALEATPKPDAARPGVGMDGAQALEEEEPYNYPPIDLLAASKPSKVKNQELLDQDKARILIETLQSFGITARLTGIAHGPTVTRFELSPAPGIKVARITSLSDDIALNLAAVSVRIEAPIPGKAAVGVEVPNDVVEVVPLRDVLESAEARRHPSRLAVALGRDNAGRYIVADLAKMPHVLIAGATGAGKSVCINALICSILYRATPDEVKLIMVDPKVVELSVYNGIPHLETPVVTDPKKAAGALQWAVNEMTDRYKKFADAGVRDLVGYNQRLPEGEKPMPQIVIIIDELADLMMVTPGEVEDAICRLAQLARAAGIHLVIATQRPSVNVITGVIKANIPSRIAFTVASQVDSRTILDVGGAEKLLGRGDMLFAPSGSNKPARVQGAWVSDAEVHDVVTYIKDLHQAEYNEDLMEFVNNAELSDAEKEDAASEYDEMLPQAIEICVEAGQASISMLQRRLRVGYARAGRLIDEMAMRGVVSQAEGAKPRNVLISREQFRMMFEE